MFNTNLSSSSSTSSSASTGGNELLLAQNNFATNQLFSSSPLNPPSCIVIGCKNGNGQSNSHVKYYQVPFIQQHGTSNSNTNATNINTARQWYINTLREDLLDYVNSQQFNQNPIHYVCIEHFDEESFIITNTSNVVNSNGNSANGVENNQ